MVHGRLRNFRGIDPDRLIWNWNSVQIKLIATTKKLFFHCWRASKMGERCEVDARASSEPLQRSLHPLQSNNRINARQSVIADDLT
jgi:hypothetical protein